MLYNSITHFCHVFTVLDMLQNANFKITNIITENDFLSSILRSILHNHNIVDNYRLIRIKTNIYTRIAFIISVNYSARWVPERDARLKHVIKCTSANDLEKQ